MAKHQPPTSKHLPRGLEILYEDRDLIVIDKPAGLLTVATDTDRERTAYFALTAYVRKGQPRSRNRVFIVHRLDRETSGVLVFAKSEEAKRSLQDNWDQVRKTYLAVVHGKPPKDEDTITTYLAENSVHVVYSTANPAIGKLSHTAYRVLKSTGAFTLLEVDLLTGRKHQIRVHLAGIGHPVAGDRKYGNPKDPNRQLALHARSLTFNHPHTGEPLTFNAKVPGFINRLVAG